MNKAAVIARIDSFVEKLMESFEARKENGRIMISAEALLKRAREIAASEVSAKETTKRKKPVPTVAHKMQARNEIEQLLTHVENLKSKKQ